MIKEHNTVSAYSQTATASCRPKAAGGLWHISRVQNPVCQNRGGLTSSNWCILLRANLGRGGATIVKARCPLHSSVGREPDDRIIDAEMQRWHGAQRRPAHM